MTDTMSESQQSEPQPDGKSSENLCHIFISKTSISALPFTVDTSKCLRRFWWCVFVVAMILAVTHIVLLYIDYNGCKKNNKVSIVSEKFEFPAVTFCNVNPMRLSKKAQSDEDCLNRRLYDINPDELIGTIRSDKYYVKSDMINTFFEFMQWESPKQKFSLHCKNCTKDCPVGFLYTLALKDEAVRRTLGHQLHDMLIKCSYNNKDCDESQFRQVLSYDYGNCYTWNINENLTYHSGRNNGLKMTFYLETDEYISGLRDRQGVRLIIHENQTFPSPFNEGIFLPGGSASTINLKRTKLNRIDAPCEPCVSSDDYMTKYKYTYSRNFCDSLCEQRQKMKTCNCSDDSQTEINKMLQNTPSRRCNFSDPIDDNCRFEGVYDPNSCGCFNPCTETVFSKEISQVNWPLSSFRDPLLVKVCMKNKEACEKMKIKSNEEFARDFLEVEMYFESTNAEVFTEEWDKRWYTFLSDVGGSTGLWLGFTAVSLVELIFIAYAAVKYSKHKLFSCKKTKDSPI